MVGGDNMATPHAGRQSGEEGCQRAVVVMVVAAEEEEEEE
jgi:hypothetical protein